MHSWFQRQGIVFSWFCQRDTGSFWLDQAECHHGSKRLGIFSRKKFRALFVNTEAQSWLAYNCNLNWPQMILRSILMPSLYLSKLAGEVHPKDIGLIGNKGPADRQPFMVAFFKTSEEIHIRRRRATNRRQRQDSSHNERDFNINPLAGELNDYSL